MNNRDEKELVERQLRRQTMTLRLISIAVFVLSAAVLALIILVLYVKPEQKFRNLW